MVLRESIQNMSQSRNPLGNANQGNGEAGPPSISMTAEPSKSVDLDEVFVRAVALHEQGQLDQAVQLYRVILETDRRHIGSLNNLAILCFQRGKVEEAVSLIRAVVRLRPDLPVAHNTLGIALRHLGRLDEAEASCREALRLTPDYAEAHNTLGETLMAQGRHAEAEVCCREALRLQPEYAEAHNNLGIMLISLGRPQEAEVCCREAVRLNPSNARAHLNLSTALVSLGRLDEAENCCREAVRLNSGNAEAHGNLGTVLVALGRLKEAEACYREAARLSPGNPVAHTNLGNTLVLEEKLSEAIASFERAAALKPDDADAVANWFYLKQRICDWSGHRKDHERFRIGLQGQASPTVAFKLLAASSTAEEQFSYACRVAATLAVPKSAEFSHRAFQPRQRLRIGYFSSSFHAHATTYLISGLIEQHDRGRFEIIGYSASPGDTSAARSRLAAAFERFVDISTLNDFETAQLIHTDAVDVLVNLDGFKLNARPKVFAYRPAPIQVNYLGYPCTMGAEFIDYIIADPFVVPPDQQPFFSERLVHLPDCYQCNDNKREIAENTPSRAECGLPETGFVFCCFNDSYKMTPTFFNIWMRLLHAVPASVLWLLDANSCAKSNLAREAGARGIAAERLVFAARLPLREHLARHRLADLFLDTLPYNAHVTASDALWAGLPVLTCAGQTFAGRVAGSLLWSVGLSDLITTSLDEYEGLALRLALDRRSLAKLRSRLVENLRISPLFDTRRSARHLEAAYMQMCEIGRAGLQPTAFSVTAPGETSMRSAELD
jgi:protein O-GlcNAc transferase